MAYREMYEIEVRHEGLNKYRHIRGSDRHVVQQKANAQEFAWDEMWERKLAAEKTKTAREAAIRSKEAKNELAANRTSEAEDAINQLETTLAQTLKVDDAIDWDSLLDKREFPDKKPSDPKLALTPNEPSPYASKYQPKLNIFDKLFSGLRKKKEDDAVNVFITAKALWEKNKEETEVNNAALKKQYLENIKNWEKRKRLYELKQTEGNKKVIEKKLQYHNNEPSVVHDYCELVLANSQYPDYFPQEWDLDYQAEAKNLIVDYSLPILESLPTVKVIKYVASRVVFTESL